MNKSDNITTREQKLEAAFLQFIKMVWKMRYRQKDFDEFFGSDKRKRKHGSQKEVDEALLLMGIEHECDLKKDTIKFIRDEQQ